MKKIQEIQYGAFNGWLVLFLLLLFVLLGTFLCIGGMQAHSPVSVGGGFLFAIFFFIALKGFTVLNPNEAAMLMFMGNYQGTLSEAGFWYYPFWYSSDKVSTKIYSHETGSIKVNDKAGNPIEIGAVVLWKVQNVAQAKLGVDNYISIIKQQAESALRTIASKYRYDHVSADDTSGETTLRDGQDVVARELSTEVGNRIAVAGLEVYEARITSLAYAPEIAGAMLQRQHAEATLAARQKLIDGVVKIVQGAIKELSQPKDGELGMALAMTDEKKADMAANLMLVLAADHGVQPVVNVGTK